MGALTSDLVSIGIPPRNADLLGESTAATITLTGNNQATAYQLSASINEISNGTAVTATGAKLPLVAVCKSAVVLIRSNNIAFAAQIYPGSGESINSLAANTAFPVPAGTTGIFAKISSTRWIAGATAT